MTVAKLIVALQAFDGERDVFLATTAEDDPYMYTPLFIHPMTLFERRATDFPRKTGVGVLIIGEVVT